MNSRKLIALFLVFALTGSALAAQQQRTYRSDGDLEASSVTAVQQHSVFIEIVVEEKEKEDKQIHEFAAVVGLIKECKQIQRNAFDNAVLWFNDQFLFGDKSSGNTTFNVTDNSTDGILGASPEDSPFLGSDGEPGRWGGCAIPDGFAHAIGADDPFGTVSVNTENESVSSDDPLPADNMDIVKEMIDLDNTCGGCIFEYHSSFFVVDPNDQRWIVDKYVYPLSVAGNFFASGGGADCGEDSSTTGLDDPRERDSPFANQHHADQCTDHKQGDDRENHCYNDTSTKEECDGSGGDGSSSSLLVEPLFSTHLQVNPQTGMGFADKASFQENSTITRDGAPYNDPCSVQTWECSIEYNFLLAVDFAAFDDRGPDTAETGVGYDGENEIKRTGCPVEHGDGGADNSTAYWQGNSHPNNPNTTTTDAGPQHCHPAVNLDIFYHDSAPNYTTEHQYWTDEHGTPLAWDTSCTTETGQPSDGQDADAISARTPIVCDADADAGEYHAHDGTQTP